MNFASVILLRLQNSFLNSIVQWMLNLKERTKTKKHHIIHNTVIPVRRKKVEKRQLYLHTCIRLSAEMA